MPHLVSFRIVKNIDSTSLSQHLQLLSPPPYTSVNDLLDFYNHNLLSILNFHAPLKTRTITFSCSASWFTKELRLLKSTGQVLEQALVTSGLMVHKVAYHKYRRTYAKELSKARSAYYSNIINNNPGNSKQLVFHCQTPYQTTNITTPQPNYHTVQHILRLFTCKIHNIQSSLCHTNSFVPSTDTPFITQLLSHFSPSGQQEVEKNHK